jgi:hypothetical protein
MRRTLAESTHLIVSHEYELAFVTEKATGRELPLGSHYGDPTCAVIAPDESWVVVAGEGITGWHRELGAFSMLRGGNAVAGDVLIRYEDPASGEQRTIAGQHSDTVQPVFIKELALKSGSQLAAVLDDGEGGSVMIEICASQLSHE